MNQLPVVRSPWRIVILLVGYTFLYAPMLMLVIYSFNSSRLVTVWAGWSTQWYHVLVHDNAMISPSPGSGAHRRAGGGDDSRDRADYHSLSGRGAAV